MATAHDERLTDELEVLSSILMNDLVIKKKDNVPYAIETVVHPSTANNVNKQFVCVTLEIIFTPDYPDGSPEVYLRNPRGLDDAVVGDIHTQIQAKLQSCLGMPVVYDVIEVIRDNLTMENLPKGKCIICLHNFSQGDVFSKTQCYHHFHSKCLGGYLIFCAKHHKEEKEKLPSWQQLQAPSYKQTCPVCRCTVSFDAEALNEAPPPVDSIDEPEFVVTPELKAQQAKMAALLAKQRAKGGVVGTGDNGPPPLTITSPADQEDEAKASPSRVDTSKPAPKPEPVRQNGNVAGQNGNPSTDATPGSPQGKQAYKGPYRGFNRRGKPGRRGRGGR